MKDKLERFIDANREAFDTEAPPAPVWQKIEKNISPKRKVFHLLTLKQFAACFLLLINAIVVLILLEKKNTQQAPVAHQQESGYIDSSYQFEMSRIIRSVSISEAELKGVEKIDPALYKNFMSALGQLNTYYTSLEKELSVNPNKEQLFEAMIQNLRLQQELLNQQLSIYQTLKKSKNETNSKSL